MLASREAEVEQQQQEVVEKAAAVVAVKVAALSPTEAEAVQGLSFTLGDLLRSNRPRQAKRRNLLKRPVGGWRQGIFEDAVGSALGIETSTKLLISNLDYGVSNEDIKELFSEMGYLKHLGIHYDRSRRSIGKADVVFIRRPDAIAAMKRYNNVQLDGKPMKIDLIGTNILPPAAGGIYGGGSMGRGRLTAPTRYCPQF